VLDSIDEHSDSRKIAVPDTTLSRVSTTMLGRQKNTQVLQHYKTSTVHAHDVLHQQRHMNMSTPSHDWLNHNTSGMY